MSVLTLPPENSGIEAFNTVHDDLLATLRLHQKHSDGSTKPIAAVLIEALTAQKEDLRAKCARQFSGAKQATGT